MAAPVDDELFADIAPHYAERAAADLADLRERLDIIAHACSQVESPNSDRRKHDDECWRKHVDCFAAYIGTAFDE